MGSNGSVSCLDKPLPLASSDPGDVVFNLIGQCGAIGARLSGNKRKRSDWLHVLVAFAHALVVTTYCVYDNNSDREWCVRQDMSLVMFTICMGDCQYQMEN